MISDRAPSPTSASTDQTRAGEILAGLIDRCASGDRSAMDDLFDQVAAQVYGLAVTLVPNPAHAEAVAVAAFHEIWSHSSRFDSDRLNPQSWIRGIVSQHAFNAAQLLLEDHPKSAEMLSPVEVVRFAFVTGLDYKQIASYLDLAPSIVRGLMRTGLLQLTESAEVLRTARLSRFSSPPTRSRPFRHNRSRPESTD